MNLNNTVQVGQPVPPTRQTASICEGNSYQIGDSTYRVAGTYLTRPGSLCDSLITTPLTVAPFTFSLSSNVLIRPSDSTWLQAVVTPSNGAVQFAWSPPDELSCPSCASTSAKPSETTEYTLVASNMALGCRRSGTVLISLGNCVFYAPDAFCPNQDGLNDVFFIPANACVQQINELTIYDRWGEVIFQCRHISTAKPAYGWDGRYHGLAVETGVYAYKLEVAFINGGISQYRGKVLLIR